MIINFMKTVCLVEIELSSHREFLKSSALFQGIATNHVGKEYSFNLLGFNEGALLIYTFLYILTVFKVWIFHLEKRLSNRQTT